MKQIDLDDLPPRIAAALKGLQAGDEVVLVQGGAVIARLNAVDAPPPEPAPDLPPEQEMKEIMEHFSAMIHDEF